ncbi:MULTISPECIES: LysR substrate-binding domain-containing protein [Bordetella]|uniref:Transcriptional regulator n=2 Tax=Bordetella TaxID=517 RepID=A0A261W2Q5_9BORD|nr:MULTISPECIES: LysR substrate-binding domain-containing protein [Bordetella]MDM9558753.1 LysR substrate-binding domain-containing protein [Bordetella petrii]OZI80002.1 transcriptional regulator [Bordetella genomosp. 2]
MGKVLPLLALRAFVETGRHGSIKNAAEAMGVTPGAVSQQIKLLQERVGCDLFVRTRQGLQLTDTGTQVYPSLMQAFDQIESCLARLDDIHARQTLTVSTVPSFAASWLVPRLGKFTRLHPAIEVRVEASPTLVDLRRDKVDIAIRHGLGRYPGLDARYLMAPALLPVAAPALLAQGPRIAQPADCLAYPLLQDSDRSDWRLWLEAMGVKDDPRIERGPAFDDDFLLIRAAETGQGIALVRDIYAREEIASGRLAVALDRPWPTEFAYYAVTLPGAARKRAIAQFMEWLAQEAADPAG